MIRKIIRIDSEKCTGCGACAAACHEGAIGMVNGKARLLREDYCDGLGDCLPACPAGAITFETREAPAWDAAAVAAAKATAGCPGSRPRHVSAGAAPAAPLSARPASCLRQWPVQLKLAPPRAPYYDGADLLVAADCTAYAYGDFHETFIRDRVTLIGCPKLDAADYSRKLGEILSGNDVRSVTVARMEVPCCGGIEFAVRRAIEDSGKDIPCRVVTVTVEGALEE